MGSKEQDICARLLGPEKPYNLSAREGQQLGEAGISTAGLSMLASREGRCKMERNRELNKEENKHLGSPQPVATWMGPSPISTFTNCLQSTNAKEHSRCFYRPD